MQRPLTARQKQALDFLAEFFDANGHAPTTREVAAACGLVSANGAAQLLGRLQDLGLVTRMDRRPRGLQITAAGRVAIGDVAEFDEAPTRLLLEITAAFERLHLARLGRVVALAPNLTSMERMLRLLAERARQLRAIEGALALCEPREEPLSRTQRICLREFRSRTAHSVRHLRTWEAYVVHEEVVARSALEFLEPLSVEPRIPAGLAVLAGSAVAARRCLKFATAEIASLQGTAAPAALDDELTALSLQEQVQLAAAVEVLGPVYEPAARFTLDPSEPPVAALPPAASAAAGLPPG